MRFFIPAAIALTLLAGCAGRSDAERARPRAGQATAIDTAALIAHTRELSLDSYEGRAPGTPGENKTVAYIAAEMAKAGLQPGVAGGWYQEVPLAETQLDPGVRLALTGPGAPPPFVQGRDFMVASKRLTGGVAIEGARVVFAGYGIHAPESGWDDYAGVDVRGAVVVVLVNDPDWRERTLTGKFGGRAMTLYGRWGYKHDEAAKRGAAAVLVVHQTEPAAYPWSVVENSWSGAHIDMARPDGGASRPALEGWIAEGAADALLKPAGGLAVLAAAAGRPGFKAVTLPWRAASRAQVAVRRFTSKNVVGVLPGRDRPGEVVLHTAHWDHLGRCPADKTGDDICNGAVDNASGIGGLLALAKAHAEAGPAARSLVFVAVTAEESGLLGSMHYAANPVWPLADTVGGLNIDGLKLDGRSSDVTVIGTGKSELEAIAARAAARQSRRMEPESTPEKGYYYRSDHFSLARVGVPMIYVEGGMDLRGKGKAAGQAAADDYTANRYHQPADEFSETWDWSGAVEDLLLYYRVGREMAMSRAWPRWLPGAEFAAARDASRAGRPALSPPGPNELKRERARERLRERGDRRAPPGEEGPPR